MLSAFFIHVRFWTDEFNKIASSVFAPIQNRLAGLFLDERTYRTFNQHENKLDFAGFMREGKVVIVALPSEWEAARLVGGLLVGDFKHLAMRRRPDDPQFVLIVDEFDRLGGVSVSRDSGSDHEGPVEFVVGASINESDSVGIEKDDSGYRSVCVRDQ
jgi:hypothetical protein